VKVSRTCMVSMGVHHAVTKTYPSLKGTVNPKQTVVQQIGPFGTIGLTGANTKIVVGRSAANMLSEAGGGEPATGRSFGAVPLLITKL